MSDIANIPTPELSEEQKAAVAAAFEPVQRLLQSVGEDYAGLGGCIVDVIAQLAIQRQILAQILTVLGSPPNSENLLDVAAASSWLAESIKVPTGTVVQ